MQGEIKENVQGINSDRKETKTQISDLEQKGETNINQIRMKKQEFKKNEKLRNLWDNFEHSNIQIIEAPEGEEE